MKKKFNISGSIGLIIALGLVIFVGICLSGNLKDGYEFDINNMTNFFDLPSIAIVVGGTIGGLIFSFPPSVLSKVGKMLGIVFMPCQYKPSYYIEQMVEYCKVARMKGILQLEESANQCTDPFMKSALLLIVDANDSDKIEAMLNESIDFMCERHEANIAFWIKGSASAPAFGMIGTLVGLINMLKQMNIGDSSGASSLGESMSVALVTTFYGCILAHCIFNPIANQLKYNHNQEVLCMEIVKSGVLAILSGANPRYVQEKLEMMLSNKEVAKNGKNKASE